MLERSADPGRPPVVTLWVLARVDVAHVYDCRGERNERGSRFSKRPMLRLDGTSTIAVREPPWNLTSGSLASALPIGGLTGKPLTREQRAKHFLRWRRTKRK
jgi:hypothetical protein